MAGGTELGPVRVLWWDRGGDGFVSSNAFGDALPEWALGWNSDWVERAIGWVWEPTFALDEAPPGTAPDERSGEGRIGSSGSTFPYTFGIPADSYGEDERKDNQNRDDAGGHGSST